MSHWFAASQPPVHGQSLSRRSGLLAKQALPLKGIRVLRFAGCCAKRFVWRTLSIAPQLPPVMPWMLATLLPRVLLRLLAGLLTPELILEGHA